MNKIIFKSSILFAALVILITLPGCKPIPPTAVTSHGDKILLELATTPEQLEKGLMFRTGLAENSGMLFVFDQELYVSFWMKNTLIPLDVIFLDSFSKIVNIQTMTPCPPEATQCPRYSSEMGAKYALEINAGQAAKLGLKTGDILTLNIPNHDQSPAE